MDSDLPVICGSCEVALEYEELFGLNREENCVLSLADIKGGKKSSSSDCSCKPGY